MNMYILQEIATIICRIPLIIYLTLIMTSSGCNSTILFSIEGESTQLNFSYPCNCSRVTLQYGNRAPSFNSANSGSTSLPSNQQLTDINTSENKECSLHLTINPISRDDAGTYILTGYNQDDQYIYDMRIGLRVSYPPGAASCDSGDEYIEGEWIRLHCSAPVGNLDGQILCYQIGRRLPPLTSPQKIGSKLNQVILARLDEDTVYCCSSTIQETKDRCECKDSQWNLNTSDNATDPCPVISTSTSEVPNASSPYPPEIEWIKRWMESSIEEALMPIRTNSTVVEDGVQVIKKYLVIAIICIALILIVISITCTVTIYIAKSVREIKKIMKKIRTGTTCDLSAGENPRDDRGVEDTKVDAMDLEESP